MTTTIIGMSNEEAQYYIDAIQRKHPGQDLKRVTVTADGEYANIEYEFEPHPFERIRRITGYLVGTMDRWNDGKKAEERDRVKHG